MKVWPCGAFDIKRWDAYLKRKAELQRLHIRTRGMIRVSARHHQLFLDIQMQFPDDAIEIDDGSLAAERELYLDPEAIRAFRVLVYASFSDYSWSLLEFDAAIDSMLSGRP